MNRGLAKVGAVVLSVVLALSLIMIPNTADAAVLPGDSGVYEARAVRQGYDDLCGAGDADNADPRMILAADCLDQIFVRLYLSGHCLGEGCLHLPDAGYGRVTVQPELAVFKVQQFMHILFFRMDTTVQRIEQDHGRYRM